MIKVNEIVEVGELNFTIVKRRNSSYELSYEVVDLESYPYYKGTLAECRNWLETLKKENDTETLVICNDCHEILHESDSYNLELETGEYITVCTDCIDNYSQCDHCSRYYPADEGTNVYTIWGNETWGDDCLNDYADQCEDCGEYVASAYINEVGGHYYCENCYPNHIIDLNYHHTRADKFYTLPDESTTLFFGVELEVDRTYYNVEERNDACLFIRNDFGDFIDLKSDSSLDNGFEMAFQPASYRYLMERKTLEKVSGICLEHGFLSHNIGTCGLHIHVNRSFFADSENAVCKLWDIFHNNKRWLTVFCRRDWETLERWAKFKDKEAIDWLKLHKHSENDRYQAINNTNSQTVEFRLFRGTLNPDTIKATIQLVQYLVNYVEKHTEKDCENLDLSQADFAEYCELTEYCKVKNLLA